MERHDSEALRGRGKTVLHIMVFELSTAYFSRQLLVCQQDPAELHTFSGGY